MNEQKEREAFEAWSRSKDGFTLDRYNDSDSTEYVHWGTEWAWQSWQAASSPLRAAGAQPAAPSPVGSWDEAFEQEIAKISTLEFNSKEICREFYKRLRARSIASSEPAAPEGWRLVPDSADENMLRAADAAFKERDMHEARVVYAGIWRSMLAAAPQPAAQPINATTLYVECRECRECGHAGINDAHPTDAACNTCGWSGPSPKEDRCPECKREGMMIDACPNCSSGRYTTVAETTLRAQPAAQEGQALDAATLTVLRGQFAVAVTLLGECIGPLEVSAAVIESDDGEQMEALIERVRQFVTAASLTSKKD